MGLNNTPIPDNLSGDDKYRWVVGAYSSADQRFTWDMFLDKKCLKRSGRKAPIYHKRTIECDGF